MDKFPVLTLEDIVLSEMIAGLGEHEGKVSGAEGQPNYLITGIGLASDNHCCQQHNPHLIFLFWHFPKFCQCRRRLI